MSEQSRNYIVVVNDDITQLCLISGILEREGFRVLTCPGAEEALQEMEHDELPSCIITDIQMPRIDGWQFCKMLRSSENLRYNAVPILMISAVFTGSEARNVSRDIGADGFLPSPFDADTLVKSVCDLIRRTNREKNNAVVLATPFGAERTALSGAFDTAGFRVYHANDIYEAQAIIERYSPELCLFDCGCVGDDDSDGIRELREKYPSLCTIALCSDIRPQRSTALIRRGAGTTIQRPFDPDYVVLVCEKLLAERVFLKVEQLLRERTWELQESKERYRSIIDAISDPVYIVSQNFVIEYTNKAMRTILGRDPVHTNCYRSIFGCDDICPWCTMVETQTNITSRFECRVPGLDRTFHFTASPFIHPDETRSRVTVLRDVTRERTLEKQLADAERLEAVGQLAGGIAHDFNNTIGAALGFAGLISEDNTSTDGTVRDQTLAIRTHKIIHGLERCADHVQQLLAYAQRTCRSRHLVSLHDIIDNVICDRQKGMHLPVEFVREYTASVDTILGDERQLFRCVKSILDNAVEALPHGGTIVLQTATTGMRGGDDSPDRSQRTITVTISDTGNGMSDSVRKRAFEPFFTTKQPGHGTGLGLAGVYGIVRSHGGTVQLQSAKGRGTSVVLWFPTATEFDTSASEVSTTIPNLEGTVQ